MYIVVHLNVLIETVSATVSVTHQNDGVLIRATGQRALNEGERPKFRLVKYYNLPRYQ